VEKVEVVDAVAFVEGVGRKDDLLVCEREGSRQPFLCVAALGLEVAIVEQGRFDESNLGFGEIEPQGLDDMDARVPQIDLLLRHSHYLAFGSVDVLLLERLRPNLSHLGGVGLLLLREHPF
jgi:hypothetical protein